MSTAKVQAMLEAFDDRVDRLTAVATEHTELAVKLRVLESDMAELRKILKEVAGIVARAQRSDWLTAPELAAELKVSREQIIRLVQAGRIRGYRLDPDSPKSHMRFDRQEVYEDLRSVT
ncbi:helix-turn-helix domain-containing protein [Spirochaeta africana]|uniref:helix-turn-helix domain-containing protein n=1 Tax=Spirochaeta africana TaxID=46355 RepID=UPI0012E9EDCB|nr:helix-turn-helix domain-containing protein [Spirochaeta africana]